MKTEIKRGLCGMCRSQCGIQATVTDGVITKVEADNESIYGRLCPRGALATSVIYGKQRLLHPLIRTGEKGEGIFRQATWEEALDYAASSIKKIVAKDGPSAIATYHGQGVLEDTIGLAGETFAKGLGTPNGMSCGSICNIVSKHMAPILTFGMAMGGRIYADIEHADAVFVWGKNTDTDDGTAFFSRRMMQAQERGAKIVVIDPRKEGIGEKADLWVPIMPGSDGALALAMFKEIIEKQQYDKKVVEEYTEGFDAFCKYLNSLETDALLARCGISKPLFDKVFQIFTSSEKIPLVSYTGLEYQQSAVQNTRAIYLLWALTGKLDVEGGLCIDATKIPQWKPHEVHGEKLPIGAEKYPVFTAFTGDGQFSCLPRAVVEEQPYAVRGLLICGGSPATTFPESQRWKEAYKKLECLIVLERYMTEDAKYADVIFPVSTWYENASVNFYYRKCQLRHPLIEPLGETKNDVFVLQNLAEKLGFGERLPKNNNELYLWALDGDKELLERMLQANGKIVDIREKPPMQYRKYEKGLLRQDGKPGFPTPSGKIEIDSKFLADAGYESLPVYHDIRDLPGMDEQTYPLMLTSGSRSKVRIGSFGQNIPEMAKFDPFPALDISAADAKKYSVTENQRVRVVSPFGSKCFTVKIQEMAPGAIHIPFGGGSSFMEKSWAEGNVNDLCSLYSADPISGFVTIKSIPCRIEMDEE